MKVCKPFVSRLWTSLCITINTHKWILWAVLWVIQWTVSQSSLWTNETNKSSRNWFVHRVKLILQSNMQMSIHKLFVDFCEHFTKPSKPFCKVLYLYVYKFHFKTVTLFMIYCYKTYSSLNTTVLQSTNVFFPPKCFGQQSTAVFLLPKFYAIQYISLALSSTV